MKSIIELTSSARGMVRAAGLEARIGRLDLGAWAQKGDFVDLSVEGEKEPALFIIRERRIVAGGGEPRLVLVLDHPPRPAIR